ncbi:MAG: di-trans,poly-cis-decaprenylcistransferase [Candidatus Methanoplasma sp.]|jgi:tritrans,polycis-undecaprenyl-diphosphate synthase [geranylgeranyl-diphosphate specific]|nr:di-trans,poly-cis-decaprenylcistransferase [Candidatus Methanoplasma sp.]
MKFPELFSRTAHKMYERALVKDTLNGPMPRHIAIIMDGNRRYAAEFLDGDKDKGHTRGEEKIEEMLEWCLDLKIPHVTVYAFSTENFKRDKGEVDFIMKLSEAALYRMADNRKIHENKVRIRVFGDRSTLPDSVRDAIKYADEKTSSYSEFNFNVAMAYGSRQEIISAVKDIARKVADNELGLDDISEKLFSEHLYTSDMPDPDLILRTSGEIRISNFLLWQLAYSELYFTDVYWPGFRRIDLLRAVRSYQQRVRRYGE